MGLAGCPQAGRGAARAEGRSRPVVHRVTQKPHQAEWLAATQAGTGARKTSRSCTLSPPSTSPKTPGVLNTKGAGREQERGLLLQSDPRVTRRIREQSILKAWTPQQVPLRPQGGSPTQDQRGQDADREATFSTRPVCLPASSALPLLSTWRLALHWASLHAPPAPPPGTDPSRPHCPAQQDHGLPDRLASHIVGETGLQSHG